MRMTGKAMVSGMTDKAMETETEWKGVQCLGLTGSGDIAVLCRP